MKERPDRSKIKYEWIEFTIKNPVRTQIQSDGRIIKWSKIESEGKYLRAIMLSLIETSRNKNMKIKYFNDTDTALLEFSENVIKETREISENIYIDIDEKGNLVSITIEHAKTTAHLPDISYEQIGEALK